MTEQEKAGFHLAIKHWYGGPCGKERCVWCEEMVKVKEEFDRQDAEDEKLIQQVIEKVKPRWS